MFFKFKLSVTKVLFIVSIVVVIFILAWRDSTTEVQKLIRIKNPLNCSEPNLTHQLSSHTNELAQRLSLFNRSSPYCENLTADWSKFNMSETFFQLLPLFTDSYEASIAGLRDSEGHSGQVAEQQMILHYLASSPAVKTVCETGFNYGHSSFNFLTANPHLKVNSFDLGVHKYSKTMAKFLPEVLDAGGIEGRRLTVRFGDSVTEVPKAIASNNFPLCDLIFVDGGHTYSVAREDIMNFARHSNPDAIIIFDDYPTDWGQSFGEAWEEMLTCEKESDKISETSNSNGRGMGENKKNVKIVELLRCTHKDLHRGFVIGRIVLH